MLLFGLRTLSVWILDVVAMMAGVTVVTTGLVTTAKPFRDGTKVFHRRMPVAEHQTKTLTALHMLVSHFVHV